MLHGSTYQKSLLVDVGGTELFKCNYDYNLLDLDNHLPTFYKQIIFYWQDIATATLKHLCTFFPHWYHAGIKQISDIFTPVRAISFHLILFAINWMQNVTFCNIIELFLLFPKIGRKYRKKVPKTQLRLPPQSSHCHARQYTVRCLTLKIYPYQLLRKNF